MKKNILNSSGETIVEVMVSLVIFVVMIALLEGAVRFATTAQNKSTEIRTNAATAIMQYRQDETTPTIEQSNVELKFYARRTVNGSVQTAQNASFTVDVDLGYKNIYYEDSDGNLKSEMFYLYSK